MNNLARFRELRGWNQRDLAEVVGVSQPTIQRAEKEDPSAKLGTYKMCADALGVTLAQVFADHDEVEYRLVDIYRQSDEAARRRIVQIVEAALSLDSEAQK